MGQNNRGDVLPWALLVLPVLWLAMLLASGYEEGMTLIDLMVAFPTLMERPEIPVDRAGRLRPCRRALLLCQ